jgi:type II secretory pathway component PulC
MRIGEMRSQGVRVGSLSTLVIIVLGVASLIAYWSWAIMLRPSPVPSTFADGRPARLASQVQARHFFGVAGEGGGSQSSISDTAQMVLAGIVSSGNSTRGLAIILIEGKKAVTARVGQEVVPDVILSLVASDYVELTRLGQKINLRLTTKK